MPTIQNRRNGIWDLPSSFKRGFGSDNHAGVLPGVFEVLQRINVNHAHSYGHDPISLACKDLFRELFGNLTESFFVFNGTAANVLCLNALVPSYASVICSDVSHLANDECAAPEKIIGCKLITLPSMNGKIRAEQIEQALIRQGDQHFAQIKAFSITQPTEVGTVYTLEELKAFKEVATKHKLFFHMDGARLVCAAQSLGLELREITTDVGVDALSLGGTKNGLLFGEATLFLSERAIQGLGVKNFKYIQKQALQLSSKTRFIAAQMLFLFSDDQWKSYAEKVNGLALELREEINRANIKIVYPVQTNAVFVKIPKEILKPLREQYFFYVWDEKELICRWMTSFDTTQEDILGLARCIT